MEGATTDRPAALDAATLAEAFQITARDNADSVALRTKDDEFSMTWAEYADKVRGVAAGLAGLGLERGGSMGIMLTNRPDFHWFDAAALHLGATPFSIYNTYAPEQVEYQLQDAAAHIVVTEKASSLRRRAQRSGFAWAVFWKASATVEASRPVGLPVRLAAAMLKVPSLGGCRTPA